MGSRVSSRLNDLILRHCSGRDEDLRLAPVYDDARLLKVFAIGKANLDEWKASGVSRFVRIVDAGDDSCPACRAHSKKKYAIDEVPQLPIKACTGPIGCRCCYVPA
jgi:hypothetical protein